jgi:hypothetical protein
MNNVGFYWIHHLDDVCFGVLFSFNSIPFELLLSIIIPLIRFLPSFFVDLLGGDGRIYDIYEKCWTKCDNGCKRCEGRME